MMVPDSGKAPDGGEAAHAVHFLESDFAESFIRCYPARIPEMLFRGCAMECGIA